MRRLKLLWKMVGLLAVMSACEHKELCFDHAHMVDLDIVFDWGNVSDASPRTMVVQFFRLDGSHFYRHEFSSRDGGRIRMEAGEYRILFHNGEMEFVNERKAVFENYELVVEEQSLLAPMGRGELDAPPRPEGTEEELVCSAPEEIWGGKYDYLEVRPGEVGQSVTLTPIVNTIEYMVEVRNVENMTNELDISAALTGMAGSLRLADGKPSGDRVSFPLALERPDDHTLVARFVAFGHCPKEEGKHVFSIYTSNKTFYNFDVTDQMHAVVNPQLVHIVVEGVKLPLPGTGMTPSVPGWDEVINVDIGMN